MQVSLHETPISCIIGNRSTGFICQFFKHFRYFAHLYRGVFEKLHHNPPHFPKFTKVQPTYFCKNFCNFGSLSTLKNPS